MVKVLQVEDKGQEVCYVCPTSADNSLLEGHKSLENVLLFHNQETKVKVTTHHRGQ